MAAMVSSVTDHRKKGFGRTKRYSLKIDMTPMVDLGFLLITFFIFTSTMSEPTSMNLIMPTDKGKLMPTKESGTITLIPAANELVYYYEGFFDANNLKRASFKRIREILVHKKRITPEPDLFVVIKPSQHADYRNVVDILDEMIISDIKRYALVKITAAEENRVNR
jgi:biopolymer transport protein ExbD